MRAIGLLLLLAIPAGAEDDRPMRWVKDRALQKQIHGAIDQGVAYLFSIQRPDGSWSFEEGEAPRPAGRGGRKPDLSRFTDPKRRADPDPKKFLANRKDGGLTAIALYALATSGVKRTDSSVMRALRWIEGHPDAFNEKTLSGVYARSLLILAYTRLDAKHFAMKIRPLARGLAASQHSNGMWGYELVRDRDAYKKRPSRGHTDNSNTQFAVLALWAAYSLAGTEVPRPVWERLERHYRGSQAKSGLWGYRPRSRSRADTMTAAGLACFVYARAALDGGEAALQRARASGVASRGLVAYKRLMKKPNWTNYYMVYSIERVGTVLDLPDLGWYETGSRALIKAQQPRGAWRGRSIGSDPKAVYETSLALLFLGRGTYPPIKGATTAPDRVDVISPAERVPMIATSKTHSRAFEIYLSLDPQVRGEKAGNVGARGPEVIDHLIRVLELDGRTNARAAALDLLQRLLAKRFLYMVDAPADERAMMAGAIRATWEATRKNVAWNEQQGRYVAK